jgi:hypothetical protein
VLASEASLPDVREFSTVSFSSLLLFFILSVEELFIRRISLEGLHNGGLIQISSRPFFIVSRLTHPKSAPGALHLPVISFNCYSTFFNPPSRYYHRTAIPSTMRCTMSSIANTYRALVTLCTNRQVTRLLKTVSTTHITRVERTISAYQ